ncbi:Octopamine receptor beta-2R [Schistosoma japonicum]|nr:Octopamine receptor beta-2R [Schistosoma japonicum]
MDNLSFLPFFFQFQLVVPIHKVVSGKDLEVPDVVRSICLWLGYLNSTINPIIYVIFNRDFRLPFREILLCRCRGMNARLRSQKYALEYGIGTSNASQGGNHINTGQIDNFNFQTGRYSRYQSGSVSFNQ